MFLFLDFNTWNQGFMLIIYKISQSAVWIWFMWVSTVSECAGMCALVNDCLRRVICIKHKLVQVLHLHISLYPDRELENINTAQSVLYGIIDLHLCIYKQCPEDRICPWSMNITADVKDRAGLVCQDLQADLWFHILLWRAESVGWFAKDKDLQRCRHTIV